MDGRALLLHCGILLNNPRSTPLGMCLDVLSSEMIFGTGFLFWLVFLASLPFKVALPSPGIRGQFQFFRD